MTLIPLSDSRHVGGRSRRSSKGRMFYGEVQRQMERVGEEGP